MTTICICGAGTMGAGIAQVSAAAGYRTILFDVNEEAVQKAAAKLRSDLAKLVEKGKLAEHTMAEVLANLQFSSQVGDCKADLVIEAIVEKHEVKISLFNQLAAINSDQTI